MIFEIHAADVIAASRKILGLSTNPDNPIDDPFLASLLRRTAGILCPCSRAALRSALSESLQYLAEEQNTLSDRISGAIERLIIGGDLLELSDVSTDDPLAKGTWVFAAPPSFVIRSGGTIFLTGIVPDHDTFLPHALASRVVDEGFTRILVPGPDEDLPGELSELGLQELSEAVWLRSPRAQSPESLIGGMETRLASQPYSGEIENLEILDPSMPVAFYRGRWTRPKALSGTFVARRPQEFGSPIWCFVRVTDGSAERLVDLPVTRSRWRGCDVAWHLQMAIDHCRGNPQRYRRRQTGAGVRLDFFSPLPQWSERRLMIFGRSVPRERSLLSYLLPADQAGTEEQFLRDMLWLVPSEDSE